MEDTYEIVTEEWTELEDVLVPVKDTITPVSSNEVRHPQRSTVSKFRDRYSPKKVSTDYS